MEGKLIKEEEGYYVFVNTVVLGTTRPLLNHDLVKYKLSLDNCEDIGEGDVIIEMEDVTIVYPDGINEIISQPKVDDEGCLILKRN